MEYNEQTYRGTKIPLVSANVIKKSFTVAQEDLIVDTFKSLIDSSLDGFADGSIDQLGIGGVAVDDFNVNGLGVKVFEDLELDIDITGPTTTVGLTPGGVILSARLIVSEEITALSDDDHHIQLGVAGTTDKYIDKANGSSATSIAKNTKDSYTLDPSLGVESAPLIVTITAGADVTPDAGQIKVEVVYLVTNNYADVA